MITGLFTRYKEENIIDYEGERIHEIPDQYDKSLREGDLTYKVKNDDTADELAHKFWTDKRFYWVILDFNKIVDPFKKLELGKELRYPEGSRILGDIIGG